MILEPVVSRLLDVKPLNAMYFKGTGLGGRGGSLSPFGPVYPGLPVYSTMTVSGAGSGTGLITGGNGINCAWDGTASTGQCDTSVEDWVNLGLTATPDAGSTFVGWGGACTGTDPCLVLMDTDKTVTATFTADEVPPAFSLSLNVAAGGTVSDSKGNGPCGPAETCDWGYLFFDAGESLVLTATPDVGYYTAWDAACTNVARNWCNLDPVATMSASADFIFTPTLTVTVTSVPDGNAGDPVASDDYGHSCSLVESPCTWSYPDLEGATITLAVTPDDAALGFPVMEISGACTASGSGGTLVSCSFTATGAKTATVNVNHGI